MGPMQHAMQASAPRPIARRPVEAGVGVDMATTVNLEVWCKVKRLVSAGTVARVMSDTVRSIFYFCVAAVLEIGGAWLVWQGVREHRGVAWVGAGIVALGAYGFVATFQPDPNFGRILAAYGGVFVAGSLLWGTIADGFRPDRYDLIGAAVCLAGVGIIMYAPRPA